jgi:hypothetical protein
LTAPQRIGRWWAIRNAGKRGSEFEFQVELKTAARVGRSGKAEIGIYGAPVRANDTDQAEVIWMIKDVEGVESSRENWALFILFLEAKIVHFSERHLHPSMRNLNGR